MRFHTILAALGTCVCLATACSKPTADADSKAQPPATASAPSEERSELQSHPLMVKLKAMVENCRFNLKHAVISHCKNKEKNTLIRQLRAGEVSRSDAVAVLAYALGSNNDKLVTAAAKALGSGLAVGFSGAKPGDISKADAAELMKQYPKLPKKQASLISAATVHAAMFTGQSKELYAVLDGLQDKHQRASAYNHILFHGGMDQLPKVKALVASEDEGAARAGLQAASTMPNKTDADRKQICELVLSLLQEKRLSVLSKAAAMAVNCGQPAITSVLDELDQRTSNRALPAGLVSATTKLCPNTATEAQCQRLRKQLSNVIESDLSRDVRAFALTSLGSNFPDATTVALAKRYRQDDAKRVRIHAKKVIEKITGKPSPAPISGAPSTQPTQAE